MEADFRSGPIEIQEQDSPVFTFVSGEILLPRRTVDPLYSLTVEADKIFCRDSLVGSRVEPVNSAPVLYCNPTLLINMNC